MQDEEQPDEYLPVPRRDEVGVTEGQTSQAFPGGMWDEFARTSHICVWCLTPPTRAANDIRTCQRPFDGDSIDGRRRARGRDPPTKESGNRTERISDKE